MPTRKGHRFAFLDESQQSADNLTTLELEHTGNNLSIDMHSGPQNVSLPRATLPQ